MKYRGIVKRSRTLDAAVLVAVLGAVELNFPLLQDMLGEWYGVSYIFIAGLMAYLRFVTTGPVGQKDDLED